MADTRVQSEVEDWVRRHWLPQHVGGDFRRERLRLSGGGVFDFDAVSTDDAIAVSISTSSCRTAGGKQGVGKMMKIRSDMLFLLMCEAKRRIVILTEADMHAQCLKEKAGGRVPPNIEFLHAEIPAELTCRLVESRRAASKETTPVR